ncbi:MAG: FAD-binding oxidoreductase [Nitrososphaerota archaeon]|nr:FAD-binding oxidoreductase [Candidatus Bathyarchaeota archaeon]MDW8061847.1 FAD-binding oxidoreductase [Nitrososphaerota archaeon]
MWSSIDKTVVEELSSIVGEDQVVFGVGRVEGYLLDETPLPIRPEPCRDVVVVKPASTEEVSAILRLAYRSKIPVFPRGGGTGLVGGCIPTRSGIILCLERMNKVTVDVDNMMAEAEAGATLHDLIEAADRSDLFFPPHPGDEYAQIGGLIACNAGGARAVRTGVMRNYVRGIEAVLPTGDVLRLGGKLIKDNTGYDLMQLIIGSEGTLAIITKAFIRLYPKLPFSITMIIPFDSRSAALKTVPRILRTGIMPLAVEYVERIPIEVSAARLGLEWPCKEGEAFLIIILAEQDEEYLYRVCEKLLDVCVESGSLEPLVAERRDEQDRILRIRSEIYTALKPSMVDILDVTVPPASIGLLMDKIDEISRSYNTYLPAYGHAGDGNIHVHIMREEGWDTAIYDEIRDKVYSVTLELGGVITGEHGIGFVRRRSLLRFSHPIYIDLMKKVKQIFDPNNILNPDKLLP